MIANNFDAINISGQVLWKDNLYDWGVELTVWFNGSVLSIDSIITVEKDKNHRAILKILTNLTIVEINFIILSI